MHTKQDDLWAKQPDASVCFFTPLVCQRDSQDMLSLFAAAASFNAPTTMVGQSAVMMRTEVARTVPQMAMPSVKDAKGLSDEDIAKEILTAQKARCPRPAAGPPLPRCTHPPSLHPTPFTLQELFELRKKVKTRQEVRT